MKNKLPNFVYIVAYGEFWKLTIEQFAKVLEEASQPGPIVLSYKQSVARKPKYFTKSFDGKYYSTCLKHPLYTLTDWKVEDIVSALTTIRNGELPISLNL